MSRIGLTALLVAASAGTAAAQTTSAASVDTGGMVGSGGSGTAAITSTLPGGSSVLPSTGLGAGIADRGGGPRVADLSGRIAQSFLGAPPPGGPATRRWTITPSVSLSEQYTDNADVVTSGRSRGDFITTLQPSVSVLGDTARAQVNLSYAPSLYYYANDHNQSRIAQNFDGRALVNIIGGLFFDVRGFGAEQSRQGALGPDGTQSISRNGSSQDYSFSASPYIVHRFGGAGTGEVGYTIARTIQSGERNEPTLTPLAVLTQNGFAGVPVSNQNVTTQNVHAAFVTGEDLGRYNAAALATGSQFAGTGVLDNAHRYVLSVDNGYAISRTITALAKIGYEDLKFGGVTPVHINDAIWSVGTRFTPNPDSTITIRYGHQDGINSIALDASYAPTARTRIYARYSEGLTTDQEDIQNALANSDLDALGAPIDHTTGAPLFLSANFFGEQSNLYRTRSFSATGLLLLDRDTFSVTINDQTRRLVSNSGLNTGGLTGSNSGIYGGFSWSHELTPRLRSSLFLQYGVLQQQTPVSTTTTQLGMTGTLSYLLGEKLYATLQYSYNRISNPLVLTVPVTTTSSSNSQNLVLLSLTKRF